MADRIEVRRGVVKVKTVRHAVGNEDPCHRISLEIDHGREAARWRTLAEISEADTRPSPDKNEEVIVTWVNVQAAQDAGLGVDQVPLHRVDGQTPLTAKHLGEDAAMIRVHLELMKSDTVRQITHV
jgi:hypothetical protein